MNPKFVCGLAVLIIGLGLCGVGIWFLLKPTEYQAAGLIQINPIEERNSSGDAPYDPYFLETEFLAMRGDEVLSNAVETTGLDTEWGKRYAGGGVLGTDQAIKLLRQRMGVKCLPNSRLIEIRITDEEPDEAARIVNAIAAAYHDYRIAHLKEQMSHGIEILESEEQTEEGDLTNQLSLPNTGQVDDPAYDAAKAKLEAEEKLDEHLKAVAEAEIKEKSGSFDDAVVVVKSAVASNVPVESGRLPGEIALGCGLAMAVLGFCLKRRPKFEQIR
jgi:uncharacterized protein involved in exopolysaccharide biosynthesis